MTLFQYDGTFEGLLTTLFDAYLRKQFPDELLAMGEPLPLFYDSVHAVASDEAKAARVWKAVLRKLSPEARRGVIRCWLSECPGASILLFRYLRKVIDAPRSIETNFADPDILAFAQLDKKVRDEVTRILQFMRFQKTADGIYFGIMEPLYNVYPLTLDHFSNRFADQQWVIYDRKRHYGFYYDGTSVSEITFADPTLSHLIDGKLNPAQLDKDELFFQDLWKSYFHSIAIKERFNPVKQRKDMPTRFWKYLTEKG